MRHGASQREKTPNKIIFCFECPTTQAMTMLTAF